MALATAISGKRNARRSVWFTQCSLAVRGHAVSNKKRPTLGPISATTQVIYLQPLRQPEATQVQTLIKLSVSATLRLKQ